MLRDYLERCPDNTLNLTRCGCGSRLTRFAVEHLHGETRFASLPLLCEGLVRSWVCR